MEFRLVTTKDYEEMLKIYDQYMDTTITFEYVLPSIEEFSQRIDHITEDYACLVCSRGEELLGYAYAHRLAERAGYNWSAELSVYTSKEAKGLKVGQTLYTILIDICRLQGIHTVYGIVADGNGASDSLHQKLGFKQAALLNNVGYKNGEWISCKYFEKSLSDYPIPPAEFKSIQLIDVKEINDIIQNY